MNSQHDESDEELARKAQDGCLQSMEALVIRHQNRLFRFLLAKTQNRSNAEDLMQETFVKAYRKIHRFLLSAPGSSQSPTDSQSLHGENTNLL